MDLESLNREIATHEKKADADAESFFKKLLAPDLLFRRASGAIVVKEEFIEALLENDPPVLENKVESFRILHEETPPRGEPTAVVEVIVRAQRGRQQTGTFTNIRVFQKLPGQEEWQLRIWVNTPTESAKQ